MNKILVYIAAIVLIAAMSCKDIDNSDNKREYLNANGVSKLSDFLKDSIIVNENGNNHDARVCFFDMPNNSTYQSLIYISRENKLFLFDLKRKKVFKEINFSSYYNQDKVDFFPGRGGEIYATKWMENIISQFDLSGKLRRRISFPKFDSVRDFSLTFYPTQSPQLYVNSLGNFISNTIPNLNIAQDRLSYYSNRPIKVAHIGSSDSISFIAEAGIFPNQYLKRDFGDFNIDYTVVSDSLVAYIFKFKPELIIENVYDNKVNHYPIKGLPANSCRFYNHDSAAFSYAYTTEYEILNDTYNGFTYDKTRNRYYLFRSLGIPSKTEDGTLSLYEDKPKLLYIIDAKNFKVINTINCGLEGKYWFYKPFILDGKLFLLQRVSEKPGSPIKIDIYEIP